MARLGKVDQCSKVKKALRDRRGSRLRGLIGKRGHEVAGVISLQDSQTEGCICHLCNGLLRESLCKKRSKV